MKGATTHDPIEEALDALRAKRHTVKPIGDDLPLWQIGDDVVLVDGALIAPAIRLGLMDGPDRP